MKNNLLNIVLVLVLLVLFSTIVIAISGSPFVTFTEEQSGSKAGSAMASGDFNNDGSLDLIIGAYNYGGGDGKAYVIYRPFSNISLNDADVSFAGSGGQNLGYAVAAGDINNDSYDDILLGSTGNTYVVYGGSSLAINSTLSGAGTALAVGDVNADGYGDAIIGGTDVVYVVYGPIGSDLNLGLSADASYANPGLGKDVAVGDLNGDGNADLIMGATDTVYVVYGPISSGLGQLLMGAVDVTISGPFSSAAGAYHTLSTGDVNNDGYDDLLIGAPYDTLMGGSWSGRAFLVYGSSSLQSSIMLELSNPQFVPEAVDDSAGYATAILDYNDDGYGDVVISSPGNDDGGSLAGKVYLFYGPVDNSVHNLANADLSWAGSIIGESIGIISKGSIFIAQMDESATAYKIYGFDVPAENMPPVAVAGGSYSGTVGSTVLLNASGSYDSDGSIASYAWDFDGDDVFDDGDTVEVSFSCAVAGTYVVSVQVTDNLGLTDIDTADVICSEVLNEPPVAVVGGPYSGSVGSNVTLDASGSYDSDGSIASYAWDLDNDSVFDDGDASVVSFSCTSAGNFTVSVEVTDNLGLSDTDSTEVVCAAAANEYPVAVVGGPYSGSVGSTVILDASASYDSDGSISGYAWDLDDDSVFDDGDAFTVLFSCSAAGTYAVSVQVTDNLGLTDMDTTDVVCSEPSNLSNDDKLFYEVPLVDSPDNLEILIGPGESAYVAAGNALYSVGNSVPLDASFHFISVSQETDQLEFKISRRNNDLPVIGEFLPLQDFSGTLGPGSGPMSSGVTYTRRLFAPNGIITGDTFDIEIVNHGLVPITFTFGITITPGYLDDIAMHSTSDSLCNASGSNACKWQQTVGGTGGTIGSGFVSAFFMSEASTPGTGIMTLTNTRTGQNVSSGEATIAGYGSYKYNLLGSLPVLVGDNLELEFTALDGSLTLQPSVHLYAPHTAFVESSETYDVLEGTSANFLTNNVPFGFFDLNQYSPSIIQFTGSCSAVEPNSCSVRYTVEDVCGNQYFVNANVHPGTSYVDSFTDSGWGDLNCNAGTPLNVTVESYSGNFTLTSLKVWLLDADQTLWPVVITNQPPVAVVGGPYYADVGSNLTLNASGSYDSDGSIASYAWDLDNDAQFDDGNEATAVFSCVGAGTFTVAVKVTDNLGLFDTGTTDVICNLPGNNPPVANAGGTYEADEGTSVLLNGTASFDPDDDIVTFGWDFDNDGVFDSSDAEPLFECIDNGLFTVLLNVSDNFGLSATDTATVNCINIPPVIEFLYLPYIGLLNETITLGVNATDPGTFVFDYSWDLDDDGEFETYGNIVNFTCDFPGEFNISVNITEINFTVINLTTVNCTNGTDALCTPCPKPCEMPDKPQLKDPWPKRNETGNESNETTFPVTKSVPAYTNVCGPNSPGTYAEPFTTNAGRGANNIFQANNLVSDREIAGMGNSVADFFVSPVYSQQQESNYDCPSNNICIPGGQCLPLCEEETHLLITEFSKNYIEIYNPNSKEIKLDNYMLQGAFFPVNTVIGSKEYLVVTGIPFNDTDINTEANMTNLLYLPGMEINQEGGAIVLSFDNLGEELIVDYVPYGTHATANLLEGEGYTDPLWQRVVYLPQRAVYNELILTELVGDWDQRIYYAELTNINDTVISTENIEIAFLVGDDYFHGTMPVYLIAPGESILVRFDSFFADEEEDPDGLGPIVSNDTWYIPFDEFTNQSIVIMHGDLPAIEFSLYRTLNETELGNLSGEYNGTGLDVLDYFIRNLNEPYEYDRGRFIYKNAVQNTFEQSAVNFRPADFIAAANHSLGRTELIEKLLAASFVDDDAAIEDIVPMPEDIAQADLLENDIFNRPCHKILLTESNSTLYTACEAAKDYPRYEYISLDANLTMQRVVFDEDEKDGGNGIDGKDPTSEKVDEHFDWLEPTPGGAQ